MLKKYLDIQNRLAEFQQGDDEGAAMVEYALLVGLIAIVALGAVQLLGGSVSGIFTTIANALPGVSAD